MNIHILSIFNNTRNVRENVNLTGGHRSFKYNPRIFGMCEQIVHKREMNGTWPSINSD